MTIAFIITLTIFIMNLAFSILTRMQLKDKEKEAMLLRKGVNPPKEQAIDLRKTKRKYYRVQLMSPIPCRLRLVDFGTEKLNRLKDKYFTGFIQDISLGGVCLLSEMALPVQYAITAMIEFTLEDQQFTLPCKFVCKESRIGHSQIKYGLQFQNLSGKAENQLAYLINRLDLQKSLGKNNFDSIYN